MLVAARMWLAHAEARAPSARDAHMGPLRLPNGQGTLTASDRDEIWRRYKVSASVRYRQQWGERCFQLDEEANALSECCTRVKSQVDQAANLNE